MCSHLNVSFESIIHIQEHFYMTYPKPRRSISFTIRGMATDIDLNDVRVKKPHVFTHTQIHYFYQRSVSLCLILTFSASIALSLRATTHLSFHLSISLSYTIFLSLNHAPLHFFLRLYLFVRMSVCLSVFLAPFHFHTFYLFLGLIYYYPLLSIFISLSLSCTLCYMFVCVSISFYSKLC